MPQNINQQKGKRSTFPYNALAKSFFKKYCIKIQSFSLDTEFSYNVLHYHKKTLANSSFQAASNYIRKQNHSLKNLPNKKRHSKNFKNQKKKSKSPVRSH